MISLTRDQNPYDYRQRLSDNRLTCQCQWGAKGNMSAQPSSSKSESSTPTVSDADIEKLLSREASAFQRELEVERILKAFKLKCVNILFLPYLSGD